MGTRIFEVWLRSIRPAIFLSPVCLPCYLFVRPDRSLFALPGLLAIRWRFAGYFSEQRTEPTGQALQFLTC